MRCVHRRSLLIPQMTWLLYLLCWATLIVESSTTVALCVFESERGPLVEVHGPLQHFNAPTNLLRSRNVVIVQYTRKKSTNL